MKYKHVYQMFLFSNPTELFTKVTPKLLFLRHSANSPIVTMRA